MHQRKNNFVCDAVFFFFPSFASPVCNKQYFREQQAAVQRAKEEKKAEEERLSEETIKQMLLHSESAAQEAGGAGGGSADRQASTFTPAQIAEQQTLLVRILDIGAIFFNVISGGFLQAWYDRTVLLEPCTCVFENMLCLFHRIAAAY